MFGITPTPKLSFNQDWLVHQVLICFAEHLLDQMSLKVSLQCRTSRDFCLTKNSLVVLFWFEVWKLFELELFKPETWPLFSKACSPYHVFIGFVSFWVIVSFKNELGNNDCFLACSSPVAFFSPKEAFNLIVVRWIGRKRRYNER